MNRFQELGVSQQYVQGVWSVYDLDKNGRLDRVEFSRFFAVLMLRDGKQRSFLAEHTARGRHFRDFAERPSANDLV